MARLILDRYRPMGTAGSGGFGTVQIAWDTRIQRTVAIKCIELTDVEAARAASSAAVEPPPWDDAWGGVDALGVDAPADAEAGRTIVFSRDAGDAEPAGAHGEVPSETWDDAHWLADVPGLDEARTAAMLSDPNIVAVYDFEVQGSTAYLIMEYVDGLTLTQVLRDHDEEMTLDIVAAVLSDVSHALTVAHKNQVLHLDIKPDNILIDAEGRAKVTDFGLATLADAQGIGTTGGGTIGYMPLEQMREEPLDARTDEWALASVVYEMLSGENPFRAPDLRRAEEAIEDAELVVPSLVWDGLDVEADDAVFYALDPDPDERYETVAEFADELLPSLGSAKRGRKQLAAIVAGLDGEEESAFGDAPAPAPAPRERAPHVPIGDRLTPRVCAVAAHVFGAAASAFAMAVALAVAACGGAAWVGAPVIGAGIVIAAVAGAIRPHAGALVSFVAIGVALAFAQAPVAGIAVVAATIAWWAVAGRAGNASANASLAFLLLGAVPIVGAPGFASAAALAAGGFARVRDAAVTAALGFVVLLAVAGACGAFFGDAVGMAGGYDAWALFASLADAAAGRPAAVDLASTLDVQRSIAGLLAYPQTWAVLIGWAGGAALFAACCIRGSRALAVAGALVGAALIAACSIAGLMLAGGGSPDAFAYVACVLPPAVCAGVASGLIVSIGVPERQ